MRGRSTAGSSARHAGARHVARVHAADAAVLAAARHDLSVPRHLEGVGQRRPVAERPALAVRAQRRVEPSQGLRAAVRIDHYPWLLSLLGTSTLLFEVGFIFAVFRPRTRVLAAFAACAFHTGIRLFLGIQFYAWLPLVMLIDLPWFDAQRRKRREQSANAVAELRRSAAHCCSARSASASTRSRHLAARAASALRRTLRAQRRQPRHALPLRTERGRRARHALVLSKNGGGAEASAHDAALRPRRLSQPSSRRRPLHRLDAAAKRPRARSRRRARDLRTSWDTLPLLERNNYKERVVRRYRVTEDGDLERSSH